MKRIPTTQDLETLWNHLDDACGSLDNAMILLSELSQLPEDINEHAERIDFSGLVNLKNKIEVLLEAKKEEMPGISK